MIISNVVNDDVLSSREAGVAHIVINRPAQRNALNSEVLDMLRRAFAQASADPLVRVVTLSGAGDRVFCAGADLKPSPQHDDAGAFGRTQYRDLLVDICSCPKPTVALARGHVLAGGVGLMLACDLALACEDIYLSTPEINVGMFPMMVMALLYRHVGRKKATEMLLLGERLTAAAAWDAGILNAAFPRGQFEAEASSYIQKLATKSSIILGLGKEAISEIENRNLQDELRYLEEQLAKVMATEDSQEGMRAFTEKREPRWRNL